MNLPSILTPDLGLLFWMALAFLVVLVFLAKYALPAIVGSVEGRKQFIDDSLRKAHEATERLEMSDKKAMPSCRKLALSKPLSFRKPVLPVTPSSRRLRVRPAKRVLVYSLRLVCR